MIAYFTDELATVFRGEVADILEGVDANHPDSENLWKNVEIHQYQTEAADMLSKDVGGRYKILTFPLSIGVQLVPLPRSVLHIRQARLVTFGHTINPANADDRTTRWENDYWEFLNSAFWTARGTPTVYVRDYNSSGLLLAPIPAQVDTLELQCAVTQGVPLGPGMPLPFLDTEDQRLMLHYMKYLAYMKHDADVLDLTRSTMFKKLFDDGAAIREVRLRSYRRRPGVVKTDW